MELIGQCLFEPKSLQELFKMIPLLTRLLIQIHVSNLLNLKLHGPPYRSKKKKKKKTTFVAFAFLFLIYTFEN